MRSSIEATIATLLVQRPEQETAKGTVDKVLSLGRQLRRDGVSDDHIATLAEKSKDLLETQLSPAKDKSIGRDSWQATLSASTLWLRSFLEMLDPGKLRRAT